METVYPASHIKRRRGTKAEMAARRTALLDIVEEQRPMTVRQVFYQATVRGLIEKTENGYGMVQTALANMRRDGEIPYGWLADNTRWMRKPDTYSDPADAMAQFARSYRKAFWEERGVYVEVWLEKDALAGVVVDVTAEFDVPLMVSRGYASLSFLHEAAEGMTAQGKPCYIYHFGDFDPSGVNAAEKIEETLCELAPNAHIGFERIAVTLEQVELWSLPTRPTKASDSRAKRWTHGDSVELDAIPPDSLRSLVRTCIERHLPQEEFVRLKTIEAAERETIRSYAQAWPLCQRPAAADHP
jgi:hypothetical protein